MTHLKEIRLSKGMTVEELSEATGLTRTQIWHYEAGRRDPDLESLCSLADVFDVSLDYLVRGKEKDRPGGRSLQDLISDYENLPNEVLERNIAVSQMILAERRLQAHSQADGKENP